MQEGLWFIHLRVGLMCDITRRGSKRKTRILWDSEMKQNDIQNMSGVGPGNTEANDAVMRPFVIPSPTFTSSESLSLGPAANTKSPAGFPPQSWSGSKGGSNDSVLRREMASQANPGFVGHFLSSSLLWPLALSGSAWPWWGLMISEDIQTQNRNYP